MVDLASLSKFKESFDDSVSDNVCGCIHDFDFLGAATWV